MKFHRKWRLLVECDNADGEVPLAWLEKGPRGRVYRLIWAALAEWRLLTLPSRLSGRGP